MTKHRVYEVAKELGINSKELIELLATIGIEVKSHMVALSQEEVGKVMEEFGPKEEVKVVSAKTVKGKKTETKPGIKTEKKEEVKVVVVKEEKVKKTDKKKKVHEVVKEEEKGIPISAPITVKGYSEQIGKSSTEVIMKLMSMGIMANINNDIDEDTILMVSDELGVEVHIANSYADEIDEEGIEDFEDKEEDLLPRPPIITVMGHVDHGKTSLLDKIRETNVTRKESGGITQHIGASEVLIGDKKIVFLDTPGHEAFTAMRARGASITDIAVLVVAADDGVKPQTLVAISHAKAANIPIIVAINKMDKPSANPMKVKQELSENGILVEEWGGDVICVPVSAHTGEGIEQLLEMILLMAEMLELKGNPNRLAKGTVIEARLDDKKGTVISIIVQNGTLERGMAIVAGSAYGRVRAMVNDKGIRLKKAGPSTAVEILGLSSVPEAGDIVNAVREDKTARLIAERRQNKIKQESLKNRSNVSLDDLFNQIQQGNMKELNIIIKADVQGSVGALAQSLLKIENPEVKINIIFSGVGTVTESDILLATASNAVIIGYNVRPSTSISSMAQRQNVDIRTYRIIYEAIDDVTAAMNGMLDPVYKEVILGKVEVRETFKVPGVGTIAGSYVIEGKVQRNAEVRLVRDGIVIYEGHISSLKRFKDDAKEVLTGYECGIGLENYNNIEVGDIIEAFIMEQIKK